MTFPSKRFDLVLPTYGGGCSAISLALLGASKSGKTTLLKYIYNEHFKKCVSIMFTMNSHADIYKDVSKKILVSENYHPELLKEAHEINKCCDNKFPFLFIFDDFIDPRAKMDVELTKCLTIYRNANMSSIFSVQGRTLMSSVGRNNINYICIFKQHTPKEWEAVIKEFLSMWMPSDMSMREMIEFCRMATEDHQFFFIDNLKGECYLSKLDKAQIESMD